MINYDLTKIKGVALDVDGVLSPSTIPMELNGEPARMVNIKDGYALQLAVKLGLRIAIITGGKSEATTVRYSALGIMDIFQGAGKKIDVLKKWMDSCGFQPEEVAYMGDDVPDIECLHYVGLSCSPADGCQDVRRICTYISPVGGGYGCVRDLLEQILRSQYLWLKDSQAFGW